MLARCSVCGTKLNAESRVISVVADAAGQPQLLWRHAPPGVRSRRSAAAAAADNERPTEPSAAGTGLGGASSGEQESAAGHVRLYRRAAVQRPPAAGPSPPTPRGLADVGGAAAHRAGTGSGRADARTEGSRGGGSSVKTPSAEELLKSWDFRAAFGADADEWGAWGVLPPQEHGEPRGSPNGSADGSPSAAPGLPPPPPPAGRWPDTDQGPGAKMRAHSRGGGGGAAADCAAQPAAAAWAGWGQPGDEAIPPAYVWREELQHLLVGARAGGRRPLGRACNGVVVPPTASETIALPHPAHVPASPSPAPTPTHAHPRAS